MIVEHWDVDTQQVNMLQTEFKWDAEPVDAGDPTRYRYWVWRVEYLKKSIANMPRCKQRQQVGLALDEARRQVNVFKRRVFG